jgi:Glycosyltransferase family 87
LLTVLWAVNLAGFWHVVELGQLYVPLLALTVAAWVSLRDGRVLPAAIALGLLIAIKPNFVVWPLLLLIAGRRDFAVPALVAGGGFALLPLVLRGPAVYESWLAATPSLEYAGLSMSMIGGNFSFVAVTGRLGLWQAGVLLSAFILAMCVLVARRRAATNEQLGGLAIATALLIGPVTWAGYSILLLPVFFCLRWTPTLVLAAGLLCWPFWLLIEAQAWGAPPELMQSVYGIGALLVVTELVRAIMRTNAPTPTPCDEERKQLAPNMVGG